MTSPRLSPAIVVAIHKSGTHLVERLLELLDYRRETMSDELLSLARRADPRAFLAELPSGIAYFFSGLTPEMLPLPLLRHWRETGAPPFIFNYRDPRAVLLSQVNYLLSRSQGGGYTETALHLVSSDVLRAQPDDGRALDVAMRTMGAYLRQSFESSVWMLHHPRVCTLRYEALVGPQGGGGREAQLDAVRRVMAHLGASHRDPAEVAAALYDSTKRTFFRGQADGWRAAYSAEQRRAFNARYADLLDTYGYPA